MKSLLKFCLVVLFSFAIAMPSPAQTAQNLVAGVGPITNGLAVWNDTSVTNLISGNALFSASGKQTVLYLGFTGGGGLDIGNMVLFKTKRGNTTIVDVIPVTYKGSSASSIALDASNCSALPVSPKFPCVVRLDPINLKLSPLYDYYFVMYLPDTPANVTVNSTTSLNSRTTILGGFAAGDGTQLTKGDAIPSNILNKGFALFLVGVMNN